MITMLIKICLGIVIFLPVFFVGISKTRKSALEMWSYDCLIPYSIVPSEHEVCIKPIAENMCL
jgi:hypothetical protein